MKLLIPYLRRLRRGLQGLAATFFNVAHWLILVALAPSASIAAEVITNSLDEREFQFLRLDNGLKVLLVVDKGADKAAAALDVNVGSGDDPVERFGLAHLLEHMLFLGTEKYPRVGGFQDFVEGHGGNHNAYTSLEHTNFFFDIAPASFTEALDRFAQFFIAPLLLTDYVERERQVVNSEFLSKITSESRRESDVIRELVVTGHPLAKFSTGNSKTLSSVSSELLQAELKRFYERYYGASRMTLVVSGPFELKQMRQWVTDYFSPLKAGQARAKNDTQVFPTSFLPAEVHIQPKKERRKLSLLFPLPNADAHDHAKPLAYIAHVLGHEGKGSLLSVLKEEGWAIALAAGSRMKWQGGELFSLDIYLTESGYEHLAYIKELAFYYVELLKKRGVNHWRYRELSKISNVAFNFAERGDVLNEVSHIANRLHSTPPKYIFLQDFLWRDFDADTIKAYLQQLNKKNVLSVIVSPDITPNLYSAYYSTPYTIVEPELGINNKKSLTTKQLKVLKKRIKLPRRNRFLSDSFHIVEESHDKALLDKPEQVYEKKCVKAWYLNDNIYDIPRSSFSIRILMPSVAQSPEAHAVLKVYTRLLRDSLNSLSYEAALAGLSYQISASTRGLFLEFYGYSDGIEKFAPHVLKALQRFNQKPKLRQKLLNESFDDVRKELARVLKNSVHNKVYSQLFAELPAILYSPYWTREDELAALEDLSLDGFVRDFPSLFEDVEIMTFAHGNLTQKHANKFFSRLVKFCHPKERWQILPSQVVKLSPGTVYSTSLHVDAKDSATIIYTQGRDDSYAERARVMLLEKLLSSPLYQVLRTEQKLGYAVFSANYRLRNVPGFVVLVQSPEYLPAEIFSKINHFFAQEKARIFANFERDRQAVLIELRTRPRNQAEWTEKYWNSLLGGDTTFTDNQRLIEALSILTQAEVEALYDRALLNEKTYVVFAASRKGLQIDDVDVPITKIEDYKSFKKHLGGYSYF